MFWYCRTPDSILQFGKSWAQGYAQTFFESFRNTAWRKVTQDGRKVTNVQAVCGGLPLAPSGLGRDRPQTPPRTVGRPLRDFEVVLTLVLGLEAPKPASRPCQNLGSTAAFVTLNNPTSEINVPARSGGTELHRALPGTAGRPGQSSVERSPGWVF